MKNKLDFICIGAPKSATTTLFDLMKDHPQIYIPPAKEVSFFNNSTYWDKGFDWFMKTFFSKAKDSQIAGTITPQYMAGANTNKDKVEAIELISERIKSVAPDVKLIAILRNPITRAFSHHKMRVREGKTDKSFEEDVVEIISSNKPDKDKITTKTSAFFSSEYGRIMGSYYKRFPKKNILVLYTDDLKKNPVSTLTKIFKFLDVSADYRPPEPDRTSHRGGGKSKIKYLAPGYLKKSSVVRFLWRMLPPSWRKTIHFKVFFWNIKPDSDNLDPNSEIYKKLVEYFRPEVEKLEKLTGKKAPWDDWR